MFDIGWSELLVIGVVAIIAIGPKDLPLALKTVGQWVAKARTLAREFQGSLDEMIREAETASGVDKMKQEIKDAASSLDVTKDLEATKAEMEKALEMPSIEVDPLSPPPTDAAKPDPLAAVVPPPPEPAPEPVIEAPAAAPKPEEKKPAEAAPVSAPAKAASGGQG